MAKMPEIELKECIPSSLLADAIAAAAVLGRDCANASFEPKSTKVYADETKEYRLNHLDPAVGASIVEITRPREAVHLSFSALDSFASAVSDHVEVNPHAGLVMVDENSIYAKWNLSGYECRDTLTLPLELTEQYVALKRLMDGVTRGDLWRLLATDLHGCLPGALELQVANLKAHEEKKLDVTIQATGLADGSSTSLMNVTFDDPQKGPQKQQLGVDWTYTGTVWSCFDYTMTVDLRMVVTKGDGGLLFTFYPRALASQLIEHRTRLADELIRQLTEEHGCDIPVYQGSA